MNGYLVEAAQACIDAHTEYLKAEWNKQPNVHAKKQAWRNAYNYLLNVARHDMALVHRVLTYAEDAQS
jgi:hypothetical protein